MSSSHHTYQRSYGLPIWLCSVVFLLSGLGAVSQGQVKSAITPDGTMGTAVHRNGRVYNIDGGTIKGRNQFHSFNRLSVGTRDTASFNGPKGIQNILSRVTGGMRSDIDGTLRSTIDGANLFLLNPAGILFGPNAKLDVSGSFHASTADVLRFADGSEFHADLTKQTTLTVAPLQSFGFLGNKPAAITIERGQLQVPENKTLSVVGGKLTVQGGTLTAKGGQVNLVSVGSPGDVQVDNPGRHVEAFDQLGDVNLAAATVEGQTVVIRGGRLEVVQSGVQATGAQASIDIAVRGEAVLGQRTTVVAETEPAGQTEGSVPEADNGDMADTSHITLSARDDIQVAPDARVSASGSQGGTVHLASETGTTWVAGTVEAAGTATTGGEVHILGEQVGLAAGASVDVSGETGGGTALVGGDFQGGNPDIKNATVTYMDPGATITADARSNGDGGTAVVWADHTARVHGTITARGGAQGGNGGLIETSGKLHLDVAAIEVDASAPQGAPGTWLLDPMNFEINDTNAEGFSDTLSGGTDVTISTVGTPGEQEGDITVAASIEKTGDLVATLTLDAAHDIIMDGETIEGSGLNIEGSGLNVVLDAENHVKLLNGASIDTRSSEGSAVKAGDVTLTVGELTLQDSDIDSSTRGSGEGGSMIITAENAVTIEDDGTIFSNAEAGSGNAGNVKITAPTVTLTEAGSIDSSTFEESTGNAGDIEITALTVTLTEGSDISSGTDGDGKAGDITIMVGELTLEGVSDIDSSTFGAGNAGDVTITATKRVTITEDSDIFSDADIDEETGRVSTGNAGDIEIKAPTVTLTNQSDIISTTKGPGAAGTIVLNVNTLQANVGDDGTPIPAAKQVEISSTSTGTGNVGRNAGNIKIGGLDGNSPAKRVELHNTLVKTGATEEGIPGIIDIAAKEVTLTNTEVSSDAQAPNTFEEFGEITITASKAITLDNSTLRATLADETAGFSGDIFLQTPTLRLTESSVSTQGNVGTVTLDVEMLLANVGDDGQPILDAEQVEISSTSTGIGAAGLIFIGGLDPTNSAQQATRVVLHNTLVNTDAQGTGEGGLIEIAASQAISLSDTTLSARVSNGEGLGGAIELTAPTLTMKGGSIEAETTGTRAAGDITLEVDDLTTTRALISSESTGGDVDTDGDGTPDVLATGNAGTVFIQGKDDTNIWADTVTLADTTVSTLTEGTGEGGLIWIDARALTLEGGSIQAQTFGKGRAGNIIIEIDSLDMKQAAIIDTGTFGAGDAGIVDINATKEITITDSEIYSDTDMGKGGVIQIDARTLTLKQESSIGTGTFGAGDAGNVVIEARQLNLTGESEIQSGTEGGGAAGEVKINVTDTVTLMDDAEISTDVEGTDTKGEGGNVIVEADTIKLIGNPEISADTEGIGPSGNVTLVASKEILLNIDPGEEAGIFTNSKEGAKGDAGFISVETLELNMNRGVITAKTASAFGGDITLLVDSRVRLRDSSITTSVTAVGSGDGGNITIKRPELVILEGESKIIAQATEGNGGEIDIRTDGLLVDVGKSTIDASSEFGVDGEVRIQGLNDLSGAIAPLSQRFSQAATLLRQRCAERLRMQGTQVSRFIVGGRDGLPVPPDGMLPSPLYPLTTPDAAGREGKQAPPHSTRSGWLRVDGQGHFHIRHAERFSHPVVWDLECAKWPQQRQSSVTTTTVR